MNGAFWEMALLRNHCQSSFVKGFMFIFPNFDDEQSHAKRKTLFMIYVAFMLLNSCIMFLAGAKWFMHPLLSFPERHAREESTFSIIVHPQRFSLKSKMKEFVNFIWNSLRKAKQRKDCKQWDRSTLTSPRVDLQHDIQCLMSTRLAPQLAQQLHSGTKEFRRGDLDFCPGPVVTQVCVLKRAFRS